MTSSTSVARSFWKKLLMMSKMRSFLLSSLTIRPIYQQRSSYRWRCNIQHWRAYTRSLWVWFHWSYQHYGAGSSRQNLGWGHCAWAGSNEYARAVVRRGSWRSGLDMCTAMGEVRAVQHVLADIRHNVDERFAAAYRSAAELGSKSGTQPTIPRLCGRQTQWTNIPAADPETYYRLVIYIPFLDHVMEGLSDRFGLLSKKWPWLVSKSSLWWRRRHRWLRMSNFSLWLNIRICRQHTALSRSMTGGCTSGKIRQPRHPVSWVSLMPMLLPTETYFLTFTPRWRWRQLVLISYILRRLLATSDHFRRWSALRRTCGPVCQPIDSLGQLCSTSTAICHWTLVTSLTDLAVWPPPARFPITTERFCRVFRSCWHNAHWHIVLYKYRISDCFCFYTCIPADLRTPDTTLCSFKRHLKAHLFQQ